MFDNDLEFTEEGDLVIAENGDLATVSGDKCKKQTAYNILKSITRDWYIDNIGADLEQLYGVPMKVAERNGVALINKALQKHSLFQRQDFFVDTRVTNNHTIVFIVIISIDKVNIIPIEVSLDLTGHIKIDWGDF